MKRLLSILLTAAVFMSSAIAATASAIRKAVSHEFISAADAVGEISAGWILGNTLDSYGTWISGTSPEAFETAWGNPVTTREMIASVKAQGFNAIRIPVTWAQNIDDSGNISDQWLARVKTVVDYAIDEDMYVILNVHHDTNGDVKWMIASSDNFNSMHDKFANLWTQIAEAFKDYGGNLMFEGYNELLDANVTWNAPSTSDAYHATNSYAQLFVDTVRATGGNNADRNLIVNTYVCSVDQAVLNNFVLPNDPASGHLIAGVHVYAPWSFTGTSESVTWTSVHSDFNDSDRNEIEGIMNSLETFSDRIGAPVIIGEWGAEYKNNDADRMAYAGYFTAAAAGHGIKCFWWDNGDYRTGSSEGGYAIFDRNSLTWRTDIVSAIMDNVQTVAAPTAEPEETEAAEAIETEATTVTETLDADVAETSETTEEPTASQTNGTTAATEDIQSGETDASSDNGSNYIPIIVIGAVVVLGAYVGLFALGRYHRKKSMK